MGRGGIDSSRIDFRNHVPLREMMSGLNDADIALDAFPYNGGTTTCHMLWMGVPVVSLAGELPVHRMGLSVLSQVGLPTSSPTATIISRQIATALANDPVRLRFANLDAPSNAVIPADGSRHFAGSLESLYRQMWRGWCRR